MAIVTLTSERMKMMPKYINAEALKAAVSAYCDSLKPRAFGLLADVIIRDVLDIIDAAPTADPRG